VHLSLLTLVTFIATAGANQTSGITVSVQTPPGAAVQRVTVVARRVDLASDSPDQSGTPFVVEGVGDAHPLDLPPGPWELQASAAGYMAQPQIVQAADSYPDVSIRLWPTARFKGALEVSKGVRKYPKQIRIEFQPSDDRDGPSGATECASRDGKIDCELPAGTFDYSFRSVGYAAIYRWRETSAVQAEHDLGVLRFHVGASLVGFVATPKDTAKSDEKIIVKLVPSSMSPATGKPGAARLLERTTTAGKRGFFQLAELAPGSYYVTASRGAAASLPTEVTILQGLEARLRDALIISPPRTISVTLTPPRDPWDKPWVVRLDSLDKRAARFQTIKLEKAPPTGTWSTSGILPGDYAITVGRGAEYVWATSEVTVSGDDVDLTIAVPSAKLDGRVTVGGKGARAVVWFGGQHGLVRVPAVTDDSGEFQVILPEVANDTWRNVEVIGESPKIRRELHDLKLDRRPTEETLRVEIALPGGFVGGRVIDESGQTLSGANVFARSAAGAEPPIQTQSDALGAFDLAGLSPGDYTFRAEVLGSQSEPTTVRVDTEGGREDVELVVRKAIRISGRVHSQLGAVYGARLWLTPNDTRGFIIFPVTTEPDGSFQFELPATPAINIAVASPGFAFRMLRVPSEQAREIDVMVGQRSGRLECEASLVDGAETLVVFHGGVRHLAAALAAFTGGGVDVPREGVQHYVFEGVEEGQYDVCAVPKAPLIASGTIDVTSMRCETGYVTNGQTAKVAIRK